MAQVRVGYIYFVASTGATLSRVQKLVGAFAAAAVSTWVFASVLDNGFFRDELIHLYNYANYGVAELLLTPHGGHLLYFSNLSYLIGLELFGLETRLYYALALATHALNVFLLQRVIDRFTGRTLLATIGATWWGCSPMVSGTIGWFAVYGHALVGTCVLWILYDLAGFARSNETPSLPVRIRWVLLLLAAAGSFGVGLAIGMVFFVVCGLILPRTSNNRAVARGFIALVVLLPLAYLCVQVLHHWLSARPPFYGIALARIPSWNECLAGALSLVDFASYGISVNFLGLLVYSDQQAVVEGPLKGMAVGRVIWLCRGVAAIWAVSFTLGLRCTTGLARSQAIGLVLLAVAAYASVSFWITLSGRLEHDVLQLGGIVSPRLWQSLEPRYHYVAPMLMWIATLLVVPFPRSRLVRRLVFALGLSWMALSAGLVRTSIQDSSRIMRIWPLRSLAPILAEIAAQPENSTLLIPNRALPGWLGYKDSMLPGVAAVFVMASTYSPDAGRGVYFVEDDPALLAALRAQPESPIAKIVLAPGEEPP